jgi:hypothetical protein
MTGSRWRFEAGAPGAFQVQAVSGIAPRPAHFLSIFWDENLELRAHFRFKRYQELRQDLRIS